MYWSKLILPWSINQGCRSRCICNHFRRILSTSRETQALRQLSCCYLLKSSDFSGQIVARCCLFCIDFYVQETWIHYDLISSTYTNFKTVCFLKVWTVLQSLSRFPVPIYSQFKMLSITYKALCGCHLHQEPARPLRSAGKIFSICHQLFKHKEEGLLMGLWKEALELPFPGRPSGSVFASL